jgi:hypothetical protein
MRLATVLAVLLLAAVPSPVQSSTFADLPTCSQAVHDQYTVVGWGDGVRYDTWHPLIDPSGCKFDHDHGSDPKLYDPSGNSNPPFGEASTQGLHASWKVYVIPDDGAGHAWMFTNHFGSNNAKGGACNRFHEIQVSEKELSNGTGHVWEKFVADFGVGYDNTGATLYTCPPPGQTVNNFGHRLVPRGDLGQFAYEPWTDDTAGTQLNLGSILTFNTRNVQQTCGNQLCSVQIPTNNSGGIRFMQVGVGGSPGPYPFTVYPAGGFFCTDPFGHNARAEGVGHTCDGNGVLQYDDLTAPAVFPWRGENAKFACETPGGPYVLHNFSDGECDMAPGITTPN